MQALKNWLAVIVQFLSGFLFGTVVIGIVHKLFFYHTLFTDPNREFVWHDWGSLAIGTIVGILLGASMAIDSYGRRFDKDTNKQLSKL